MKSLLRKLLRRRPRHPGYDCLSDDYPGQCCYVRYGVRCTNRARWAPLFWVSPINLVFPEEKQALLAPVMAVCDEHKTDDVREVFSELENPDAARSARLKFHESSCYEPDLENPRIEWLPVVNGRARV